MDRRTASSKTSPAGSPPAKNRRKVRRRFSSTSPSARDLSNSSRGLSTAPVAGIRQRGRHTSRTPPNERSFPWQSRSTAMDAEQKENQDASLRSAPSYRTLYHKDDLSLGSQRSQPLLYSSLPPTPISPSPSPRPFDKHLPSSPLLEPVNVDQHHDTEPFSLWDYLREELLATDFDSHQELKWDRVSNFLNIPFAIEKIIGFGFIVCFDSFLYTFTILPIRFFLATFSLLTNLVRRSAPSLPPSQKADILRALLLIVSIMICNPLTDASKIYHTIRGQDTIKLYVIFNALEIGDRLCASIGQDIIDCLFSRSTLEPLSHRKRFSAHTFRPILFFLLATFYVVSHSLLMVYQLISLNVAVNSYDHALLTLLVSNQFVEIKGSVFKKFEKDNLFQIACADIVERFSLALMLTVVAFRNLIELSGSEFDFSGGYVLPTSFGWLWGNNILWTVSYPVLTVMVSEMLVDWLKHAFITKFNHIRPSVYDRYIDVLCQDLASGSAVGRRGARKHTYVDQSPLVARRLGFSALPLAVLAILIGSQSVSLLLSSHFESTSFSLSVLWSSFPAVSSPDFIHYATWAVIGILSWLCLVGTKIIIGVNLLSYAAKRREGFEERAAADVVNDFGRDPIGEGNEEKVYNKKLKTLLDNVEDDQPRTAEMGENKPSQKQKQKGSGGGGGGKRDRIPLEELTRYTMVKRIW